MLLCFILKAELLGKIPDRKSINDKYWTTVLIRSTLFLDICTTPHLSHNRRCNIKPESGLCSDPEQLQQKPVFMFTEVKLETELDDEHQYLDQWSVMFPVSPPVEPVSKQRSHILLK